MSCLCGGHFRSILDRDGRYQIGDGGDGQVVGQDTEASRIGSVRDADFLAFWVYVSIASDLVAEWVTKVGCGLSRVRIAESGPAEFVLGVVLAGRVSRIAVNSWESSSRVAGVGRGADIGDRVVSAVISTISAIPLCLCSNSQNQKASDL